MTRSLINTFSLTRSPIIVEDIKASLSASSCGALVSFEGMVRNTNNERDVTHLIYSAYESMSLKQGNQLIESALSTFDIEHAVCVHRLGELAIGDIAIFVGVTSPHRDAGFNACRTLLDDIKAHVPIFKEEFYTDSDASCWLSNNG